MPPIVLFNLIPCETQRFSINFYNIIIDYAAIEKLSLVYLTQPKETAKVYSQREKGIIAQ